MTYKNIFFFTLLVFFTSFSEAKNLSDFFSITNFNTGNALGFVDSSDNEEATPILKIKLENNKKEDGQSYVYIDRNGYISSELKIRNHIVLGKKDIPIQAIYTIVENSKPVGIKVNFDGTVNQFEPLSITNTYIHLDFSKTAIKLFNAEDITKSIVGGSLTYQQENEYKYELQNQDDFIIDTSFICLKSLGLIGLLGLTLFSIGCYKEYRNERSSNKIEA